MPDYLLSFYVGETKEALRRFYMYLNYIYLDFCKALDTVSLNVFVTILKVTNGFRAVLKRRTWGHW